MRVRELAAAVGAGLCLWSAPVAAQSDAGDAQPAWDAHDAGADAVALAAATTDAAVATDATALTATTPATPASDPSTAVSRPATPASEPSTPVPTNNVSYPTGWNLYVPAIEYGGGLLGSALGAGAFGYVGGMVDNAVNGSCLMAFGGCFPVLGFSVGAVIGQTLGSPVAVILTGRLLHRHGSITGAFLGSGGGTAVTVLTMVFSQRAQQSGILFIALVATLLPPLGSMLGYDLFRNVDAEQDDLNHRRAQRHHAQTLILPAVTGAVDAVGNGIPIFGIVGATF